MRVFFDNGTPAPLRRELKGLEVTTAYRRGWHNLRTGEFLARVEADGFDAFVTTDQSIRHQQNLSGRRLAILVILTTDWGCIRRHANVIAQALDSFSPCSYVEVDIP